MQASKYKAVASQLSAKLEGSERQLCHQIHTTNEQLQRLAQRYVLPPPPLPLPPPTTPAHSRDPCRPDDSRASQQPAVRRRALLARLQHSSQSLHLLPLPLGPHARGCACEVVATLDAVRTLSPKLGRLGRAPVAAVLLCR